MYSPEYLVLGALLMIAVIDLIALLAVGRTVSEYTLDKREGRVRIAELSMALAGLVWFGCLAAAIIAVGMLLTGLPSESMPFRILGYVFIGYAGVVPVLLLLGRLAAGRKRRTYV